MKKVLLFSFLIINLVFSNSVYSHVLHYKNLNKLIFDIYRNSELIGQHIFLFDRKDNKFTVKSTNKFEVKMLGVSIYKYFSQVQENYIDGKLESFQSNTNQNKKKKFVKKKVCKNIQKG